MKFFQILIWKTNIVDGQQLLLIRGKNFAIFSIWKVGWLRGSNKDDLPAEAHVVVVTVVRMKVGFVVDQLVGQEEVVNKPLGKMLQGTAGVAGRNN